MFVWPLSKRMTAYTVHEPPFPAGERMERAEQLVFIKDGFSWPAFLFGPFWLFAQKLWVAAAGYIVIVSLASLALTALGVPDVWITMLTLGLNLALGFEAPLLQTAKLEQQGWAMLGAVSGRGIAECERRFLEDWEPSRSEPPTRTLAVDQGSTAAAWRDAVAARGLSLLRRKG